MIFTLLLISCGKETQEKQVSPYITDGTYSECDPLDPGLCAFPFPNSFFLKVNEDKPSGFQVDFRVGTLPENANGHIPDPWLWNEKDGFSTLTPIMTFFPNLSTNGLLGHNQLGDYLSETVSTVIIDVSTGERVPHFAELDMSHDLESRRALRLYPVEPLKWSTRYVVGIRNLLDNDGVLIEPSEGFASLVSGEPYGHYDIDGRREHFENIIFPNLEGQGFERSELQIAWDFVVGSKEETLKMINFMRLDAMDRMSSGINYTIDEVETFAPEDNEFVAKRIYGTMSVPYYTETPESGQLLTRNELGLPYYVGETEREFTVVVPRSLWEEGRSGPILQYGHGLMGGQSEVKNGYLGEMADRYGYVLLAADWSGMSGIDVDDVMLMVVNEIDRFGIIPERSQQGFIEQMAAAELLRTDLAQDPELMTTNSEGQEISVVNTEEMYYYGNSQGGILGNAYFAMSPHFTRGVLGVGGAPYALLLPRSYDFESYFMLFKTMYPDYMEISLWIGLMQMLWDPAEPTGYLDSLTKDPLPGNSEKTALLQVAIGDAQVTTLGAHVQARGIGAGLLEPSARDVWGLEPMESGEKGSALVEWDYDIEEPFISTFPDPDTDPHGRPRKSFAGQEQLNHFLKTGEVVNFCNGSCDSEDD